MCREFGHDREDCPYEDPHFWEAYSEGTVSGAPERCWLLEQKNPSPPKPKRRKPDRFCGPAYNQIRKRVFVETVKSWSEAQSYCREMYTDLATVYSQEEAKQLLNIAGVSLYDKSWIGLYTFYNWSKGEPNNDGGNQNCVKMSKTGGWLGYDCNSLFPFFCCEGGSSGQCFYEETKKTWQEAQSYCRNQSRDLPSIHDQARVNELIGLISSTIDTAYWIGLYHDKENWQWSSGGDVIYSNWEPHLFCASVNAEGEWEDSICDQRNYFMCYSGELRLNSFVNETGAVFLKHAKKIRKKLRRFVIYNKCSYRN
ncbi:macrophage mannose receptor 1-like [Acipenser oxyrinchus oxyrinchus]|uniref:Macrophage mannose receptor 1-like n=1 Tax=Acipenser oxyrinchus oxyrinchus TaxID=40147 RepID=A0AAD8CNK6_ACIOX|nr:macrophage mannose receptor 1-like [Acipenser oxyrinchus oxyrinchus]